MKSNESGCILRPDRPMPIMCSARRKAQKWQNAQNRPWKCWSHELSLKAKKISKIYKEIDFTFAKCWEHTTRGNFSNREGPRVASTSLSDLRTFTSTTCPQTWNLGWTWLDIVPLHPLLCAHWSHCSKEQTEQTTRFGRGTQRAPRAALIL